MGDFDNQEDNNNVQPTSENLDQQVDPNQSIDPNQSTDSQQSTDSYQQTDPYQQPQFEQPQYQQSQYSGQSGYQQSQYQQPGYQQNPYQTQYQQPVPKKSQGLAIASLICGILGVVACCIPYVPAVISIAGLILGILSIKKKEDGRTMAIVGIVLSAVGILIGVIMIIFTAVIASDQSFWNSFYEEMQSQSSIY